LAEEVKCIGGLVRGHEFLIIPRGWDGPVFAMY